VAATEGIALGGANHIVVAGALDERTRDLLERRRATGIRRRRGWLMRRMLLAADLLGLLLAFVVSDLAYGMYGGRSPWQAVLEHLVFAATLPAWIVLAKLEGLYDHDEERTDHTTVDELAGVFRTVTIGTWLLAVFVWLSGIDHVRFDKLLVFWLVAVSLVTLGRIAARSVCRQNIAYLQSTVIVGAGDIGQLVARKILHHPEYGLNVVGFVDLEPKERRVDLGHLALLGPPDELPAIIRLLDVDRVIVAFSRESNEQTVRLVRSLNDLNVQIDIVPRLFELLGPRVEMRTLEGMPLVGFSPAKLSRSSLLIKRSVDIAAALVGLALTAPLLGLLAVLIKRDSPGPVFFRQTRLGMKRREFEVLKFRTMRTDADETVHRAYIEHAARAGAAPCSNGLYKLDRSQDVTRVGRWLRRTSLDELPQLVNVLRGEMSIVGPRPCIPYETEHFADHHFERFLVPAGITGLWQVTARAHASFAEALDMDVAYARSWSLALDFTLMLRTVRHLLARPATA
jgi:exopolysaccharide biosynthesis polyprenyl glycosylphosphotransferase